MVKVHEQKYATPSDKRLIIKYKNNFLDQGDKELKLLKAKLFSEATKTPPHFSLPKVMMQVQNGNGVLKRLVSSLKCMELAC